MLTRSAGVLLLALLMAGGLWAKRELEIDRCLDASGQWNYDARLCIYAP